MSAGDPVYFDGTDWELADASDNTKFAEAIATNNYSSGEVGTLCISCIVVDIDAPYTQGDNYFLSETAGAVPTATRPTTTASLRQVIGFGLSTSRLRMDIVPPREEHMWVNTQSSLVAAEVVTVLDSGNFGGILSNNDGEVVYLTFACPQNCVGLEFARSYSAVEVRTNPTDYTVTVSGAADGEQHDATTQDATLTDMAASGAAEDEIEGAIMTTGFDATGIIEPDNLVGVKMVHDGGETDATLSFGIMLVFLVV
ncbi:hypothetical protein LCGC14_1125060 [marine sediment metagenome]|uniref:Uncharacterized protein n=1 Tax=marine sediment metagenome TaxID=412755 RepID=A0A0F9PKV9_9ZZZZ